MRTDPPLVEPRSIPAARTGLLLGSLFAIATAVAVKSGVLIPEREDLTPDPRPRPVAVDVPPQVAAAPAPTALRGPAVVNVWLQGCADCMPAFQAWKSLVERKGVDGMVVRNVAYGSATVEFARAWHVDSELSFDGDGTKVVQPLGIGTFTTLVLDRDGRVVFRQRPTAQGFQRELEMAWALASRT